MSFDEIDSLIDQWRKGKRRQFRGRTFANNIKGYQWFVARVASEYVPRIREFVSINYLVRKEALKVWRQLVAELEEDLRMLDAFDPRGKTQFYAGYLMAQQILHDKAAVKAFERSLAEPVDEFGNSVFVSGIAACLDTVLDQTFHAMRGLTGQDLRLSLLRKASQRLHNALAQGSVKDLRDARALLLPQLGVVEMELEKFQMQKLNSMK